MRNVSCTHKIIKYILLLAGIPMFGLQADKALADGLCDGRWVANYKDMARNWDTTATITISGKTATFTADLGHHNAQNSPCRDHTFPARVLVCTADMIEFKVDGSEVMSPRNDHCPNWHVKVKRTDPNRAEGFFVEQHIPVIISR